MAYVITYDDGRVLSWKQGDKKPFVDCPTTALQPAITHFLVTEVELAYVRMVFKNLPIGDIDKGGCRWRGWDAQFLYDNL